MLPNNRRFLAYVILATAATCLILASTASAYIDLAPTMSKVLSDSKKIALVEVVSYDRDKKLLTLKEIRVLKGEASSETVVHSLASNATTAAPRMVLQWAVPGAQAVMFSSRTTALVCVGQGWYQTNLSGGSWKLGANRADLPLAYYGATSRLVDAIEQMLAGGNAMLTVVAHGADSEAASFDLALNRVNLPALVRVERICANLKMPQSAMAASGNATYIIGSDWVDQTDLPYLTEKLGSADPAVRADAADYLWHLGRKAKPAAAKLTGLLKDASPRVRLAAAATLLHMNVKDAQASALDVLTKGLNDADADVRCEAAKATGLAGPAAKPLAAKLAAMLKDADESTRNTALQAIAMLGQAASDADVVTAVTALLDLPDLAIDAADALGRIGAAAKPALPKLTKMLSDAQPTVRWAAVRAMSQIGGQEAHPAVDFMVRAFKSGPTEVEGYNMMIYLAMLGPVASDAASTIQSTRIKNPVLPSATLWAISPTKGLPWQSTGGGNMGGPGGGRGGMGGPGGMGMLIYQAYVHELGYRIKDLSGTLATKIMDNTAGEVPEWGYDILACGPKEAVQILAPYLADKDIVKRERAAVALGYMGAAGVAAKDQVTAAISKASAENEKRLMQWCLREITSDE